MLKCTHRGRPLAYDYLVSYYGCYTGDPWSLRAFYRDWNKHTRFHGRHEAYNNAVYGCCNWVHVLFAQSSTSCPSGMSVSQMVITKLLWAAIPLNTNPSVLLPDQIFCPPISLNWNIFVEESLNSLICRHCSSVSIVVFKGLIIIKTVSPVESGPDQWVEKLPANDGGSGSSKGEIATERGSWFTWMIFRFWSMDRDESERDGS